MPANRFKRKEYGTWNVFKESYSRSELEQRRAQLAKVANSRILKLERGTSQYTGEAFIKSPIFNIVTEYLENQNKRRFSESRRYNKSDFQLKMEINVLEQFLEMKSSTIGGIRMQESKRADTFVSKGVPYEIATSPEFYDFLNSETFNNISKDYADSEDIIDIISRASDDGLSVDDILVRFENWKGKTRRSLFEHFGLSPVKGRTF